MCRPNLHALDLRWQAFSCSVHIKARFNTCDEDYVESLDDCRGNKTMKKMRLSYLAVLYTRDLSQYTCAFRIRGIAKLHIL